MTDLLTYIAIGSNQHNARVQTVRALRALAAHSAVTLQDWSHNYTSAPLVATGDTNLHDTYQNLVACVYTSCTPQDLLLMLLAIETQLGRTRTDGVRWQSRVIDLDIALMYTLNNNAASGKYIGKMMTVTSEQLQVPHYHLAERNFVLTPLAELLQPWPDFLPTVWSQAGLTKATRFAASCVRSPA